MSEVREDGSAPPTVTSKQPDACMCNHGRASHRDGTGPCDDTWAFGVVCVCRRYRSARQIHDARKEEAFWRRVGRHE